MDRRSEVVMKPGQRQLHGARAAAGLSFSFENLDLHARLRQHDGRRQPVGAGADNASLTACKSPLAGERSSCFLSAH